MHTHYSRYQKRDTLCYDGCPNTDLGKPISCPACAQVPPEKMIAARADGHVTVNGNTGLAIGCSIDGGYRQS